MSTSIFPIDAYSDRDVHYYWIPSGPIYVDESVTLPQFQLLGNGHRAKTAQYYGTNETRTQPRNIGLYYTTHLVSFADSNEHVYIQWDLLWLPLAYIM